MPTHSKRNATQKWGLGEKWRRATFAKNLATTHVTACSSCCGKERVATGSCIPLASIEQGTHMEGHARGLFGRHVADTMRWSGGCGGCWSPPIQDIVLDGATSKSGLLQGRSKWHTRRKAVLLERGVGTRDVPANLPSRRMWCDRLLRSRSGSVLAHGNQGARGLPRRRGWAQSGRQSEAPSVSTLSIIQEQARMSGWPSCG